jgi:SAM-dependent methyltransferase
VLTDGPYSALKRRPKRYLYSCRHCGHMSVDLYESERHAQYYHALRMDYYRQHDGDTWRYCRILELLSGEPVNRVLDIGCGIGTLLSLLPTTTERFGIELSAAAAEVARQRGIQILSYEDLQKPHLRHSFDLVTAVDVVEHTQELTRLRQHFCEALRPGGRLILLTGDLESRPARWLGRYWYYRHYAEHVSFFSGRSMRRWLEPDFESIQVMPTSHHPLNLGEKVNLVRVWTLFPLKWLISMLPVPQPRMHPALWLHGDHMFVSAVRRNAATQDKASPSQFPA